MANPGTRPSGSRVTPEPSDVWEAQTPDGATIVIRRHGNPTGPAMIVSHGNGLAVDAYHPFWSLLAGRFDLFVHDVRNHGWNPVGERRIHHVPQFTEDAECIARSIDGRIGTRKPRIGVFHSLSALVALRHAAAGGEYAALVLFDPPVCPPGGLPDDMEAVGGRLAEMTRKRKEAFGSPDELAAAFSRSPLFERMRPETTRLLARSTVRRCGNGDGYELRCPREYEAQVLEYFFIWSMTVDFAAVPLPGQGPGLRPHGPQFVHAEHGPRRARGLRLRLRPPRHRTSSRSRSRGNARRGRLISSSSTTSRNDTRSSGDEASTLAPRPPDPGPVGRS